MLYPLYYNISFRLHYYILQTSLPSDFKFMVEYLPSMKDFSSSHKELMKYKNDLHNYMNERSENLKTYINIVESILNIKLKLNEIRNMYLLYI